MKENVIDGEDAEYTEKKRRDGRLTDGTKSLR
jgi:hypothetical protein